MPHWDLNQFKQLKQDWIEKAESNGWVTPKARFIILPAQSDGDDVILYHPENTEKELGRICFSVCLGKGQKDIFSTAQYFYPKSSGHMDAIGLQITTAGNASEKAIETFKNENDSLETAQNNKIDYIIKKLNLKPNQKVLDIGSGWGFLAIEIAKKTQCQVLGITLSQSQFEYSKKKTKQMSLKSKVT